MIQNLSVKAIEIISSTGGGTVHPQNTAPGVNAGANASATTGTPLNLNGTVNDDGLPNGTLTNTWSKIAGPGSVAFGNASSLSSSVSFSAAGNYTLRLTATDGQLSSNDDMNVTVTVPASTQNPIHINVGGPSIVANGINWIADNPGNHGYVNTGTINSYNTNTAPGNIPANVPTSLFKTERWDAASGAEMQWDIPVSAGQYEVRLYFAENWPLAHQTGIRIFDVEIEGVAINNIDVFDTVGANTGMMLSTTVTSDTTLDIDFSHVVQNPALKAIEILPL